MPVFPTPVGMNRYLGQNHFSLLRVPHACGDEPPLKVTVEVYKKCSPRLWG